MDENKKIKISLKMAISIFIVFVIVLAILIFVIINKSTRITPSSTSKNITVKTYQNEDFYIIKGDYSGEYDLQYKGFSDSNSLEQFGKQTLMNYVEYKNYCSKWELKQKYTNSSQNYIVFSYIMRGPVSMEARLAEVEYNNNDVTLYIWDNSYGVTADISAYVIIIPTTNSITSINVQPLYTQKEFNNIKKYDSTVDPSMEVVYKPIIYLYPKEKTEVLVKLGYPDKLTCSYPKYSNNGWKVSAMPNGNLVDLLTKKNLYALYYESEEVINFKIENTGFVVKGEDSAKFLEDKLEILGLNEREAEEFIIYWLPKLEANNYNYIRFATIDEINKNMPLNISPNPDTIIRVLMTYKPLENPINVVEQNLITPQRNGFVAVEWGGTEIK